jgi:hypothetical protein
MVLEDIPRSKSSRKQIRSRCFRTLIAFNPVFLMQQRLPQLAFGMTLGWIAISGYGQARAADLSIGNGGLRFNKDTTLETDFVESHGAYQSTFGVVNLDTQEKTPLLTETRGSDQSDTVFRPSSKLNDTETKNDFLGTAQTVPQGSGRFTFKPGGNYSFYLESTYNGRPTGIVYSTDKLNPNQEQQVTFTGNPANLCQGGGMIMSWDDTGSRLVRDRASEDRDFDDFIVRLRDTACPVGADSPPATAVAPPETAAPPIAQGAPVGGGAPAGNLTGPIIGGLALAGLIAGVATSGGGSSSPSNPVAPPPTGAPPGSPEEPIPEPLTILGSGTALGFAALMQRRRAKARKKDKQ